MSDGKQAFRITEFDLWKFIFAFIIVILHFTELHITYGSELFPYGSIAVDFFFLVSGFLMAKSVAKKTGTDNLARETLIFLKRRIKTFLPYFIFAVLIGFISYIPFHYAGIGLAIKDFGKVLFELLLVRQTGLNYPTFTITSWYLSAMLLSMAILYPLLLRYKTSFSRIVAPLIAAFVLGYLYLKFGNYRAPQTMSIFFMTGTLRGFSELSLGIFCYEICEWLKKFHLSIFIRLIFTIIEYCGLVFIIYYANEECDQDPLCVIIFAAAIIIMGGNFSLLAKPLEKVSFLPKLGTYSLMLFLNHGSVSTLFKALFNNIPFYPYLFYYLAVVILKALICWIVVDLIQKSLKKNKEKIRQIFIK